MPATGGAADGAASSGTAAEGMEQFKRDLDCQRNAKNENRLDWLLRPDLMSQFEVAGTLFRHIV